VRSGDHYSFGHHELSLLVNLGLPAADQRIDQQMTAYLRRLVLFSEL
jgi:hypothetical protein